MGRWLCSVSQRAFALIRRAESPLIWRYRDAAERREKGRLCFIEGKGISFISNNRNFEQEKVDISRKQTTPPKTSGLSCENALVLHSSSHLFRERRPPNLPHFARFLRAHERVPERTRTCTSRTQRVCFFCLHPSPSHLIHCHTVDYE